MNNQNQTNEQWRELLNEATKNICSPVKLPNEFGEYFFYHFLECLPPILFSRDYTLCSEPHSDVKSGTTYIGVYKRLNQWYLTIDTITGFKNQIK